MEDRAEGRKGIVQPLVGCACHAEHDPLSLEMFPEAARRYESVLPETWRGAANLFLEDSFPDLTLIAGLPDTAKPEELLGPAYYVHFKHRGRLEGEPLVWFVDVVDVVHAVSSNPHEYFLFIAWATNRIPGNGQQPYGCYDLSVGVVPVSLGRLPLCLAPFALRQAKSEFCLPRAEWDSRKAHTLQRDLARLGPTVPFLRDAAKKMRNLWRGMMHLSEKAEEALAERVLSFHGLSSRQLLDHERAVENTTRQILAETAVRGDITPERLAALPLSIEARLRIRPLAKTQTP